MKKKATTRQKPFLLLEILITIALLSTCAVPLLRNPLYFYKKEITHLQDLAKIQLENESLAEIKELLLKNQIPWEDLSGKKKSAVIRNLPNKTLIIKGIKEETVPIYYRVWTKKEKKCQKDVVARILGIQISIKEPFNSKKKYTLHQVYAQKIKEDTFPKNTPSEDNILPNHLNNES